MRLRPLWRIPLRYAIGLALPVQLLFAWIAYDGHVAHHRLSACASGAPPWDYEQWRYFARRELRENFSRLTAPSPRSTSIETVSLTIDGGGLAALAGAPVDQRPKVACMLELGDERRLARATYAGSDHWHWLYPQKSWRIELENGEPWRGRTAFDLINPTSRAIVDAILAAAWARQLGILAPEVEAQQLLLNGANSGVYLRCDLADASFLWRSRRPLGNVYEGRCAPGDAEALFEDAFGWRNLCDEDAARDDLEALLSALRAPEEFARFADRHLNLERFADFYALREWSGWRQVGREVYTLYVDPLTGRFEPIQTAAGEVDPGHVTRDDPLLRALRGHRAFEVAAHRARISLLEVFDVEAEFGRLVASAVELRPALQADARRDTRDWEARDQLRLAAVPRAHYGLDDYERSVESIALGLRARALAWKSRHGGGAGLRTAVTAVPAVSLGPGVVELRESRTFAGEVSIEPGTTLRLGPGVTLRLRGRVDARGSERAPIAFERSAADQPWGVVELFGRRTAGSRFEYCRFSGGSVDDDPLVPRSGMVSVIETRDVVFENCSFHRASSDYAMHWGAVDGGAIRSCRFEKADTVALGLDLCDAVTVSSCRFVHVGKHGLELATSSASVAGCGFFECGGAGISAGAGSTLEVRATAVLRCVTGVEVKDDSRVKWDGASRIDRCGVGVHLHRQSPRSARGGELEASRLWITHWVLDRVDVDKGSLLREGEK